MERVKLELLKTEISLKRLRESKRERYATKNMLKALHGSTDHLILQDSEFGEGERCTVVVS